MSDIAARLAAASRALVLAGGGLAVAGAGIGVASAADAPGAAPGDGPGDANASAAPADEPAAALPDLSNRDDDWAVDASFLSYGESDGRTEVFKTLANLSRATDTGSLVVGLVHDTMSGASPTGGLRGRETTATYSGPSGGGGGTAEVSGGDDAALAPFDDERVQASVAWQREVRRNLALDVGGVVSQESDYDSLGANVGLARTSADQLWTTDVGLAFTTDVIDRSDTGGTPEPLADTEDGVRFGDGTRNTADVSLGVSRVLNRRTVAQATLQLGRSSGYHTDPYKILSVADDEGRLVGSRFESRPAERTRTSLGARLVHRLAGNAHSVHLDYRLYGDDWGVVSTTVDARYRHRLTKRQFVEPHVRLYRQGPADFYVPFLAAGPGLDPVLPEDGLASADYRLDGVTSTTFGVKYGLALTPDVDLRVRAEYLQQDFDTTEYDTLAATFLQTSVAWRF